MTASRAERLLAALELEVLERSENVIAALLPDGTIAWVNGAWGRFAARNGAPDLPARFGVGASYWDGVSGELRDGFAAAARRCLETASVFSLDYECSSAEELRWFRMRMMPVGALGLWVEHAALRSVERGREGASPATPELYRRADGYLLQCSNCRKTARGGSGAWDVVLEWISRSPPRTTHGLCGACLQHYYPLVGPS